VEEADEAFAEATSLMWTLILFGVIVQALVAVVAWFVTSRIANPLERVVWMITEIGRGRLSHRLDIERDDEIGVLAQTMNTLADDLQQQLAGQLQ
ncbi:HAMP domain-containing protein, partial [Algoriphagus aestuarii]|nr:HAMP domain-containing protein [Algoriphagus aestuarii]